MVQCNRKPDHESDQAFCVIFPSRHETGTFSVRVLNPVSDLGTRDRPILRMDAQTGQDKGQPKKKLKINRFCGILEVKINEAHSLLLMSRSGEGMPIENAFGSA